MLRDPLAFLLTFRTYGTWLHGIDDGSVDKRHNTPGTPFLPADEDRLHRAAIRMKWPPLVLTDAMRQAVKDAIVDQCRYRGWELIERNVRTNHAHVVIGFAGMNPEAMAGQLKARATR